MTTHLGQFIHFLDPIARLHDSSRREIHALNSIPSITDRRSCNGRLLEDDFLRIAVRYRLWLSLRHADTHHRAIEPQEIQRLRIGLDVGGAYNHGTGAQAVSGLDNFFGDTLVIVLGDINEALSTTVLDKLLFRAVIDTDNAHRHTFAGELGRDVA